MMFVVLQMICALARRISFNSVLKTVSKTTSVAFTSNQQLHRNMSTQSIDAKFQLPKRYQGQTPSVW